MTKGQEVVVREVGDHAATFRLLRVQTLEVYTELDCGDQHQTINEEDQLEVPWSFFSYQSRLGILQCLERSQSNIYDGTNSTAYMYIKSPIASLQMLLLEKPNKVTKRSGRFGRLVLNLLRRLLRLTGGLFGLFTEYPGANRQTTAVCTRVAVGEELASLARATVNGQIVSFLHLASTLFDEWTGVISWEKGNKGKKGSSLRLFR
ncbi:uncharacterized protein MCYG_05823 [Microsporum canis CBS 113480]|uniref:Uncharacterized protein n=1 Tax=Arthroderma otae (strain ATCC MYA-4605 / CBS 113480) TaxID=554155 RepID=C5FT01_ARTOC|nr:uncharacterized protein MCYG_05823 [Microsporum canis CBS 113480]EEQ33004.1 predicted protein [Microsporum canis CBS 113480]